jgi:hypothetical protein
MLLSVTALIIFWYSKTIAPFWGLCKFLSMLSATFFASILWYFLAHVVKLVDVPDGAPLQ